MLTYAAIQVQVTHVLEGVVPVLLCIACQSCFALPATVRQAVCKSGSAMSAVGPMPPGQLKASKHIIHCCACLVCTPHVAPARALTVPSPAPAGFLPAKQLSPAVLSLVNNVEEKLKQAAGGLTGCNLHSKDCSAADASRHARQQPCPASACLGEAERRSAHWAL